MCARTSARHSASGRVVSRTTSSSAGEFARGLPLRGERVEDREATVRDVGFGRALLEPLATHLVGRLALDESEAARRASSPAARAASRIARRAERRVEDDRTTGAEHGVGAAHDLLVDVGR